MNDIEVYLLCSSRTARLASHFLDTVAPKRRPVAEVFPYPEFAVEPAFTFDDPIDLLEILESNPNEAYAIYWNVEDSSECEQAMLFFTEDGGMIAGIGGPKRTVEDTLASVGPLVDAKFGYVTSGSCPPGTIEEFRKVCTESTLPNLFEGGLRT